MRSGGAIKVFDELCAVECFRYLALAAEPDEFWKNGFRLIRLSARSQRRLEP